MQMNDMILVSVDDHVVEPPDMFDRHIPARYKDRVPKLVQNERGDTPLIIAEGKGTRFAGGQGLRVHESTASLLRQLADDQARLTAR